MMAENSGKGGRERKVQNRIFLNNFLGAGEDQDMRGGEGEGGEAEQMDSSSDESGNEIQRNPMFPQLFWGCKLIGFKCMKTKKFYNMKIYMQNTFQVAFNHKTVS